MPSRLPNLTVCLVALLAFLGFVDSAYLAADHYLALPLPCSLTNGCDTVLTSQYSMVGPIPLAMLGVAYYLLALLLAVYLYTSEGSDIRPARAICFLGGVGVLASLYFIYLQMYVIKALCVYCLGSALSSTLLFLSSSLLLWQMSRRAKVVAG